MSFGLPGGGREKMRQAMSRSATMFLLALALIGLDAAYWQVWRADALASDPALNRARLQAEEKRVRRGNIISADGVTLATTQVDQGNEVRVYPLPALSHIVGFHTTRFGNAGIEASMDQALRGEAGLNVFSSTLDDLLHRRRAGADVVLTINTRLQQVGENALGNRRGAIVLMEPDSGAIRALVSHPNFDANKLSDIWQSLQTDPGAPLLDRATQGQYSPGSIFKTVTLIGVLDQNVAQPETPMDCPSVLTVNGFKITNNNEPTDGRHTTNLILAYAFSCNTAFARLGLALGGQRLTDYARRLGFEKAIPLQVDTAPSQLETTPNFLNDQVALASTAFGQGELLVTPLQMALVAGTVANGGLVPQPTLVQEVRGPAPTFDLGLQRLLARRVMSPIAADEAARVMTESVKQGYAAGGAVAGVPTAGKTGTAQAQPDQPPHAWYIGYAPADKPQYAVAVIVENAGEGAVVAAPVAKAMLAAALGK